MTDMEHKPNGWNLPINQMTEEEWKEYFECRKKYDIHLSEKEIAENLIKANKVRADQRKYIEISRKIPLLPSIAIVSKAFEGLKALRDYNLSWAKEVYPDEF
ncbi:hypothetical protein SAMN02910357_00165 [Succinivibrio dextrinosolvens]|uniref:hypothetical protein n=1 Tax=Succinivibrio dextrinosolvens TaxID=83771 RepID=UPI0008F3B6DF|nr:hypothetical protein [Succinivibrio dextrinosolvens]SFS32854.1 hypothetical protein SAMN02910357_00165 [Succinivibrio dextrinosolvens]